MEDAAGPSWQDVAGAPNSSDQRSQDQRPSTSSDGQQPIQTPKQQQRQHGTAHPRRTTRTRWTERTPRRDQELSQEQSSEIELLTNQYHNLTIHDSGYNNRIFWRNNRNIFTNQHASRSHERETYQSRGRTRNRQGTSSVNRNRSNWNRRPSNSQKREPSPCSPESTPAEGPFNFRGNQNWYRRYVLPSDSLDNKPIQYEYWQGRNLRRMSNSSRNSRQHINTSSIYVRNTTNYESTGQFQDTASAYPSSSNIYRGANVRRRKPGKYSNIRNQPQHTAIEYALRVTQSSVSSVSPMNSSNNRMIRDYIHYSISSRAVELVAGEVQFTSEAMCYYGLSYDQRNIFSYGGYATAHVFNLPLLPHLTSSDQQLVPRNNYVSNTVAVISESYNSASSMLGLDNIQCPINNSSDSKRPNNIRAIEFTPKEETTTTQTREQSDYPTITFNEASRQSSPASSPVHSASYNPNKLGNWYYDRSHGPDWICEPRKEQVSRPDYLVVSEEDVQSSQSTSVVSTADPMFHQARNTTQPCDSCTRYVCVCGHNDGSACALDSAPTDRHDANPSLNHPACRPANLRDNRYIKTFSVNPGVSKIVSNDSCYYFPASLASCASSSVHRGHLRHVCHLHQRWCSKYQAARDHFINLAMFVPNVFSPFEIEPTERHCTCSPRLSSDSKETTLESALESCSIDEPMQQKPALRTSPYYGYACDPTECTLCEKCHTCILHVCVCQ